MNAFLPDATAAVDRFNDALATLLDALQSDTTSAEPLQEAWNDCLAAFEACRDALGDDPAGLPRELKTRLRRALRLHAVATSLIENERTALLRRLATTRTTRDFLRAHRPTPPTTGESCDVEG